MKPLDFIEEKREKYSGVRFLILLEDPTEEGGRVLTEPRSLYLYSHGHVDLRQTFHVREQHCSENSPETALSSSMKMAVAKTSLEELIAVLFEAFPQASQSPHTNFKGSLFCLLALPTQPWTSRQ